MVTKNKVVVLIVEDEVGMSHILTDRFELEGFDVLTAHNGEEGLKRAMSHHPDIILLGILMPKMDGVTMIEKLREDTWGEDVPIICLTNLEKPPDKLHKRLKRDDKLDYIVKVSTRLEDIVQRVKTALGLT